MRRFAMRKGMVGLVLCLFLFFLVTPLPASDDVMTRAQGMFRPIPETPPILEGNPLTPEKLNLGKLLYFDPRLSASGLISCNTCHNIGTGGVDLLETSVGHGWQRGGRNAPTVFNAIFNIAQFWDGRAQDLKEQAKGPPQAAIEMNNTPERLVETLKSMPEYVDFFEKAFPQEKDPLTFDTTAKAIEAFEAILLTPDSRFDKYLKGDSAALSREEEAGLRLFMDKGCAPCHGGVNLGGTGYFPFGLVEKPKSEITAGDVGRFQVTGVKSDEYVFKSPSLRNIALTPPYFHSGRVWSLRTAVAIMGSAQLGISLTENEAEKIVAFLRTTTGVQPKVEYPILPARTERTPKPKLD
jgi:cytochrome c peroxidase